MQILAKLLQSFPEPRVMRSHKIRGSGDENEKDMTEMRMRYRHLFCTSSHHDVPYEQQQELNKGSES